MFSELQHALISHLKKTSQHSLSGHTIPPNYRIWFSSDTIGQVYMSGRSEERQMLVAYSEDVASCFDVGVVAVDGANSFLVLNDDTATCSNDCKSRRGGKPCPDEE
mmetsp:Transcript_5837/g.10686  ORF Transcript_5837/g.10686 Transcript_5837/m.10686 type:complete len:106 (+) Transcript_5837:1114-1431(+)